MIVVMLIRVGRGLMVLVLIFAFLNCQDELLICLLCCSSVGLLGALNFRGRSILREASLLARVATVAILVNVGRNLALTFMDLAILCRALARYSEAVGLRPLLERALEGVKRLVWVLQPVAWWWIGKRFAFVKRLIHLVGCKVGNCVQFSQSR